MTAETQSGGTVPLSLLLAEWQARRLLAPRAWDPELTELHALILKAIEQVTEGAAGEEAPMPLVLAGWLTDQLLRHRPWDYRLQEMRRLVGVGVGEAMARRRRDDPPWRLPAAA
ncbi:MAG: hypothetical protein AB7V42_14465 [Thermoleophilia bacterium]